MNPIARIENADGEVYAVLSYQPDLNYLLMKWIGFCTDDELKQATLHMLHWQKTEGNTYGCRVHVHDTKEFDVAWVGAIDWIVNDFFANAYDAGLRLNISVLSPDLFSKLSSEALFQQPDSKVPTHLFETLEAAESWIRDNGPGLDQ
ncbi:hypothetical protein DYU11_21805 [Fibrisoma montanum]|uniref:STAS/SEC14 domain-containing protein n=1 Tax=Fibrisoma montanum TaxID=2305895 RepID=A0A418M4Q6_9BACT|nr:hypothetical protein [Fibrisoma montanum]RIV20806.1 hypothetical protein DYU11_21805 [Fibrisoma montanum]